MLNHIKSLHDETKSWCGELLGSDFHFKTVEAAVLNGIHEAKIIACSICTDAIIDALMRSKHSMDPREIENAKD